MPKRPKTKLEKFGEGLGRLGCLLTVVITFPFVGFVIAGPVGGIVALAIGLVLLSASISKRRELDDD
jgi:hypothetical protein